MVVIIIMIIIAIPQRMALWRVGAQDFFSGTGLVLGHKTSLSYPRRKPRLGHKTSSRLVQRHDSARYRVSNRAPSSVVPEMSSVVHDKKYSSYPRRSTRRTRALNYSNAHMPKRQNVNLPKCSLFVVDTFFL